MKKALALLVALFSIMLAAPASAQDATVMLAHGIPDTDVDIVVDGGVVIADFNFGEMEDLSAFSGQTLTALTVNLAGTDTVALDLGDFAVPASGNYTVIQPWPRNSRPITQSSPEGSGCNPMASGATRTVASEGSAPSRNPSGSSRSPRGQRRQPAEVSAQTGSTLLCNTKRPTKGVAGDSTRSLGLAH